MKSFTFMSALAAASIVNAGPTPTENELPKRADSLPTVTASGNGKTARHLHWTCGKHYLGGNSLTWNSILDWKRPLLHSRNRLSARWLLR